MEKKKGQGTVRKPGQERKQAEQSKPRQITYRVGLRSGRIRSEGSLLPTGQPVVTGKAAVGATAAAPRAPQEKRTAEAWSSGPGRTNWVWRPLPGPDKLPPVVWAFVLPAATIALFVFLATRLAAA